VPQVFSRQTAHTSLRGCRLSRISLRIHQHG
jgi:hypothetical protein